MKRLVWIPAVMFLLAVCFMLSAAGEGAAWPPAGKTEAGLVKTDYVSTPDDTFYIHTGPDDEEAHREYRPDYWLMAPEGGVWEEAVWYRVTFLSGDEHLRNFFESQEDGAGIYLNWDASTTAGTAEFRIDMESSDLWASFTVRPKVWDARDYSISLAASDVYVPVGRITNMNDLFTLRAYATVEPDTPCDCRILPPDGEDGAMETKDWKIDGYPYFTAKKAGDYDMVLRVSVGYALHRDFPITVHASKKVQAAYVDGDAPPSASAVRQAAVEEQRREARALDKYLKAGDRLGYTGDAAFIYHIYGGEATVKSVVPLTEAVQIPAELGGARVTAIAAKALRDSARMMTSLSVAEGIRSIGADAFRDSVNLSELTLPSTLEKVGARAFAGTALTGIALPEGVYAASPSWNAGAKTTDASGKWIYRALPEGGAAITGWSYGKKLVIPAEVDGLPVTAVDAPEERLGKWAALSQLSLPDSLRVIGERAFEGSSLTELTIPAGVETVGDAAFNPDGDAKLKKVTFLGARTALGKGIFGYSDDPSGLLAAAEAEDYQLFQSLMEDDRDDPSGWLDHYADKGSGKVPELAVFCWPGSTADRLYTVHTKKTYLKWTEENVRTAPAEKVLGAGVVSPDDTIYELIVPEGVEEIADGALAGTPLCRVTLPSTLRRIGEKAFSGCGALLGIVIPEGVEEIGAGAFENCTGLTSATLPDGIRTVPDRLFLNCAGLSRLTMKKTAVTRIGESAFEGCAALAAFPLEKGLEEIGANAFRNSGLKSARLPETVTALGAGAFAGTPVTTLVLPAGLAEVPENLCDGCADLKTVQLQDGITRIGKEAFRLCASIASVNFPEGLESIGDGAFMQSSRSASLYYSYYKGAKKATKLKALKLPASLRVIGAQAFAACDAIAGITFAKDARLEEIGEQAFGMCMALKELKLPDSVRILRKEAFVTCMKLQDVKLGCLEAMGDGAFSNCVSLAALAAPDTLTEIGEKILEEHGAKLKVTCAEGSAMDAYLQANYPDIKIVRPK